MLSPVDHHDNSVALISDERLYTEASDHMENGVQSRSKSLPTQDQITVKEGRFLGLDGKSVFHWHKIFNAMD